MKEIVAIVKPFRVQAVLEAIAGFRIESVRVREVRGYARPDDAGPAEQNIYLPKLEISLLAPDESVDALTEQIVRIARTGRIGDGKIFVLPVDGAINL